MKIGIGRKIAHYRKEKSVTQEQLAHALGVSTAAVSKWETGSAYPDITLLPDIAAFFRVSVDLLLDYQIDHAQQCKDRIRELAKVSDYHAGLPLAEEAYLQHFTHETPCYSDLICSSSWLKLAKCQAEAGDQEGMWESIRQGVYHAVRFDQAPAYDLGAVKFMDGSRGWLGNNSSENACGGTLTRLENDFPQYLNDDKMQSHIRELEAAATDKVQSGVWSQHS